jgi:hypothetical protein
VQQRLDQGHPVWIAVRDVPQDANNPYPPELVVRMIQQHYGHRDDVLVSVIPDISSVNYGRKVGYEVTEWTPPENVGAISATAIRNALT